MTVSAKALEAEFRDLEPRDAARLARILNNAEGRESEHIDSALKEANRALEGHGVEALRHEGAWDNYYGDVIALYVNMGDPYVSTIVYDPQEDEFALTTWGDWYESFEREQQTPNSGAPPLPPRRRRRGESVLESARRMSEAHAREHRPFDPESMPRMRAKSHHFAVNARSEEVEAMLDAYITAALWSSNDEDGEPLDANYDETDISEETRASMRRDVERFAAENARWIEGAKVRDEWEQAGHDFWLTRNRHGAGFWDGDWPEEAGKRLTEASHAFGEVHLYVGDDGEIHSDREGTE